MFKSAIQVWYEELKIVDTPLANKFKLSLDQFPKTDAEAEYMSTTPYYKIVGCLMYVMVCTIPNLAKVTIQLCKFMSKPRKLY